MRNVFSEGGNNLPRLGKLVATILLVVLCLSSTGLMANAQELNLSAQAAVLMEASSGEVIYEKKMHEPLPMASITKIMTMVLALEAVESGRAKLDDLITTSEYANRMGGSQIWLEVGEQMPLKEMLYAIAVGSANDAAVAVAEYLCGSEASFADEMNRRARELGMKDTFFSNASGLPPKTLGMDSDHHSSAYDIALLSRHAMSMPLLVEMVSAHEYIMRRDTTGKPHLYTLNELLDRVLESGRRYGYPGLDGIKTGMTSEAGYCLAASAKRDGMRLVSVVLGNPTKEARQKDTVALMDYGFRLYEPVTIARAGEPLGEALVSRGKEETVSISVQKDLTVGVPRGTKDQLTWEIEWWKELVAPLEKDEILGELVVKRDGREVGRAEVVCDASVERASMWQIMIRMSKRLLRSIVPGR